MTSICCPKCKHTWTPEPTWRSYLSKKPGSKVHFFSMVDGRVVRTRLHFSYDVPFDTVITALRLVEIEHKNDTFFRWCDVITGTVDEVGERILATNHGR